MFQYKHSFHAGNYGDILKHFTLIRLLERMKLSISSPFTVIDTHSSNGRFFYKDEDFRLSKKAPNGISRILSISSNSTVPQPLVHYLNIYKTYSKNGLYPGSPEIERLIMRKSDYLYLCDINPNEILKLRKNMDQETIIKNDGIRPIILNKNGFDVAKDLTPPQTNYGMVLIDPPFDKNSDFYDSGNTICKIMKKWSNGIIMLWYPINAIQSQMKDKDLMIKQITNSINSKILNVQLLIDSLKNAINKNKKMYGSGLIIINPPNGLEDDLRISVPWIQKNLSKTGSWSLSSTK